ncbi:hypothetical protein MNBD_GAMMA17-1063 [hydrothermal vent metagenome]|uniref:Uncharacterized protein n=1 Tax=hydrothermal vent metagenome TaxID=652676 RepID=A0A3B0Z7U8_9ZZZZ
MSQVNDKNIQFSEYSGKFIDQVNDTDKLRTESMTRLKTIRRARQESQKRQLKKITERLGPEHPKVLQQMERIIKEKDMEDFLAVSISKSDTDVEIIKDSFIFRGRILGDDTKGREGVTVQLQDSRNNVIGKPVKTDKNGTYSLVLDIDESFKLKKAIAVVLVKGIQVHKEKLPVMIKANAVELREIVIVSTDKPSKGGFSSPAGDLKIKKQVAPKETVVPKNKIKTPDNVITKEASTPKAKVATKKVVKKRVVRKTDGKSTK